jgi:multidrug efflux pump subunit AcrA (membrane-fusion protein)
MLALQQIKGVKMEVDIQMMAYLNEEQDGTKKNAVFVRSHEQLAELEATIAELRKAETEHHRAAQTLASARDKAARHASFQVHPVCPVHSIGFASDQHRRITL